MNRWQTIVFEQVRAQLDPQAVAGPAIRQLGLKEKLFITLPEVHTTATAQTLRQLQASLEQAARADGRLPVLEPLIRSWTLSYDIFSPRLRRFIEIDDRQDFSRQRLQRILNGRGKRGRSVYPEYFWQHIIDGLIASPVRNLDPPHHDDARAYRAEARELLPLAYGFAATIRLDELSLESGQCAVESIQKVLNTEKSDRLKIAQGDRPAAVIGNSTSSACLSLQDPFAGYGPQRIRCRWLSAGDEQRAASAQVIRLVVDGSRWAHNWANATYQQSCLREVANFVGPTRAVLATPAGMVTTTTGCLNGHVKSLKASMRAVNDAVGHLDMGPAALEVLLGIDACVPGEATPIQTVVHFPANARLLSSAQTIMKLLPKGRESEFLMGWLLTQRRGMVPDQLAQTRRVETRVGLFLVLVDHDSYVFSANARLQPTDPASVCIRKHLQKAATTKPRPDFILLSTHQHETHYSGAVFKNAAQLLAKKTGSTVITTLFAPKRDLARMAECFRTHGKRADAVVTLLVEDT